MNDKYVLALGYFDGIHLGHTALLRRTVERAAELGARSAVVTFDVHPDTLVHGSAVPLINHDADRVTLIHRLAGIESVFFLPFTRETMETPWELFLDELSARCGAAGYVVGHDFRFGHRGKGSGDTLRQYGAAHGLCVDVIDAVYVDGAVASSTRIRQLLEAGDLAAANRVLGHPHLLSGHAEDGFLPWAPQLQKLPRGRYAVKVNGEAGEASVDDAGIALWGQRGELEIEFYSAL